MKLGPDALIKAADMSSLAANSTADIAPDVSPVAQDRALEAIDFGTGMNFGGYNLYALGSPKTNKRAIVLDKLNGLASEQSPPRDYCYIENFTDPGEPLLVSFANGLGRHFERQMQDFVSELQVMLPAAYSADEFRQAAQRLTDEFQQSQSEDISALEREAQEKGLAMLPTPNGYAFAPMADDKVMGQEAFINLPEDDRQRFQAAMGEMTQRLVERLREYPAREQHLVQAQRDLTRETALRVLRRLLSKLRAFHDGDSAITSYLDSCQTSLLDNLDKLDPSQPAMVLPGYGEAARETYLRRFEVNLLVDHSSSSGAPVIYESNPSLENLVGKVEHRIEYGNPVTDFTQIRPGALHRANGGYLVLDAERLIQKPFAWEALKRAMSDEQIRIESVSQLLNLTYSVSLEPQATPLDTKIVLLGSRPLYHLLRQYDPDFDDLFKIVADFSDHIPWTETAVKSYAALVASIVRDTGIPHLDMPALARVIEHLSREVEDRESLSTHVTEVRDLVLEAAYLARRSHTEVIDRTHIVAALDKRSYRLDRFRELVRENIARGLIRIETTGEKVGQINGLSVVEIGQTRFGQPLRITATARLGRGELIDIERESHLGGKIHSKAVMIVSSFLGARFAQDFPLSLHASLVFEQSYAGVEGDSASVAEVCALLSAIAKIPIRQSLAITGSMDQHGVAQAIGGVNEKIEGFFEICRLQGLDGVQGVIIPAANTHHLMLREDVVAAVSAGKFHIYTMETVDDAIELLLCREGATINTRQVTDAVRAQLKAYHESAVRKPVSGDTNDAYE